MYVARHTELLIRGSDILPPSTCKVPCCSYKTDTKLIQCVGGVGVGSYSSSEVTV